MAPVRLRCNVLMMKKSMHTSQVSLAAHHVTRVLSLHKNAIASGLQCIKKVLGRGGGVGGLNVFQGGLEHFETQQ